MFTNFLNVWFGKVDKPTSYFSVEFIFVVFNCDISISKRDFSTPSLISSWSVISLGLLLIAFSMSGSATFRFPVFFTAWLV